MHSLFHTIRANLTTPPTLHIVGRKSSQAVPAVMTTNTQKSLTQKKTTHNDALNSGQTVGNTKAQSTQGPTQVAGHAGDIAVLDSDRIVKIMGEKEAHTYVKYGKQLKGIIPNATAITPEVLENLPLELRDKINTMRQTKKGELKVILSKVGGSHIKPTTWDIKLAKSTTSKTQLVEEGHSSPITKKIRMTSLDLIYGSRSLFGESRGYRMEGPNLPEAHGASKRDIAKNTNKYMASSLTPFSAREKNQIIDKMIEKAIETQSKLNEIGLVFIGSSFLISTENGEKKLGDMDMRLIDLAHPVEKTKETDEHFKRKQQQFNEGIDNFIKHLENLRAL